MSLKISDKNRPRFTLVVILLIFVSITAYSLNNAESKEKITVDEGYGEATVLVPPAPEDGENQEKKYFENESTATTLIKEDHGHLELEVSPRYWHGPHDAYMCFIEISVRGNLSSELDPEEMVIETQGIEAPELDKLHIDHQASQWDAEGLELWPGAKRRDGVVGEQETRIGSYVEDGDNFSVDTEIIMEHPTADLTEEPITLEFRASLQGLSEEVTSTVRVSFTQEGV